MKFLCDRCKTRYSIGDDRVRGKILKIRCKNCANVITVREGMTDADASVASPLPQDPAAASQRRDKKTTMAPAAQVATPAAQPSPQPSNGGSAKPPAALEEEWYVSIDGEQAGPYSLHEAQRWVGGKPGNADLHCWSEGFDDWLPVDKVSHFRGLRKPTLTPVNRAPAPRAAAIQPAPIEEEPKPLFAATMASLEKGAALAAERALAMPALKPNGVSARATPPQGHVPLAAKTNGATLPAPRAAANPLPAPKSATGPLPALRPLTGAQPAPKPVTGPLPAPRPTTGQLRAVTTQGIAEPQRPLAKGIAGFDISPEPDQPTQIEALAYVEPEPPRIVESSQPADDLDIGEVSRVVKLADIMNAPRKERTAPVRRAGSLNSGIGRATGSAPAIGLPANGTASNAAIAAGIAAPFGDPALAAEPLPELAPFAPPPPTSNKLYVVLLAVSLLLLGAVGVVVFVVTQGADDQTSSGLVKTSDYDTTRPDDPTHHNVNPETGSATTNPFVPRPPIRRPPPLTGSNNREGSGSNHDDPGSSLQLKADEVESEAAKHSLGTQRCYMRSQKGEQAIIVGEVKRISVTLVIEKDGNVNAVSLSEHGGDSLGTCLINQVKSWKFRENNGGTFKITMVFQGA